MKGAEHDFSEGRGKQNSTSDEIPKLLLNLEIDSSKIEDFQV